MRAALAVVLGSLLTACSAHEAPLAETSLPVVGGEPTGSDQAGVLYATSEIRNIGGTSVVKIGSSALVAPNLIMTALHVVSQNPSDVPFTCDDSGSATSGSSGASLGAPVAAEKVSVYEGPEPTGEPLARGTKIVSTRSTTICQNDLAFVVLDRALDLPTYRIHRGEPAAVGDELTVVGYGSGLKSNPDAPVRTERAVDVIAVGQWIRTFTVSAGPCEGDSGGPALSGSGEVVGIFSSVARDCTLQGAAPKYTDVSYFSRVVEEAFAAADAGSPWPSLGQGGAGGEGGNDAEPAGARAAGGEAPTSPAPSEESREDSNGCSASPRAPSPQRSTLTLLALGAALSRRVRRRGKT